MVWLKIVTGAMEQGLLLLDMEISAIGRRPIGSCQLAGPSLCHRKKTLGGGVMGRKLHDVVRLPVFIELLHVLQYISCAQDGNVQR